jgi:hypothetical protein
MNRRLVAFGPPSQVFTRDNLNATYEAHLIFLPFEGAVYARHHGHD